MQRSNQSKVWSKLGLRASFGLMLAQMAESMPQLIVLSADTSTSAGLDRFRKLYSNRYIECGIAEQNMIGVASALANEGWSVVAASFSPFITLRCLEQIKVQVSYNKNPVIIVGIASGVALGDLGYTHCSIEDVGAILAIPGIHVFTPCDGEALEKVLPQLFSLREPVYVRLMGKAPTLEIHTTGEDIQFGVPTKIREGEDVLLLAQGTTVAIAIEVADILNSNNVSASVYDVHSILAGDNEEWLGRIKLPRLLVATIEEHRRPGPLWSLFTGFFASTLPYSVKVRRFDLGLTYGKSGEYSFMLDQAGLTSISISTEILKNLYQ